MDTAFTSITAPFSPKIPPPAVRRNTVLGTVATVTAVYSVKYADFEAQLQDGASPYSVKYTVLKRSPQMVLQTTGGRLEGEREISPSMRVPQLRQSSNGNENQQRWPIGYPVKWQLQKSLQSGAKPSWPGSRRRPIRWSQFLWLWLWPPPGTS